VQIDSGGDEILAFDAGSGLRELGSRILADGGAGRAHRINLVLSHLHWDHILGFPFFLPAYVPGNLIRIHGCHPEEVMREAFGRLLSSPCFPVDFHRLGAAVEFVPMEEVRSYEIAGVRVRAQKQHHPFDSFGYRIEKDGRAVVYSTDSEHKEGAIGPDYPQVDFLRRADVVIFDAQYSLAEATSAKEDWGHSSNIVGVELCQLAEARHLVLFHHDPGADDLTLARVVDETRRYEALSRRGDGLRISAAYDGMEIDL
jgi:phosphoribosyl 1,2-cyclic phosphodiesterase